MKRKICFINESRSEYGILYPLMRAIKSDPDLTLSIIVTNMHLSKRFGNTVKELEQDGFAIDRKIPSITEKSDNPAAMVDAFAKELKGIKDELIALKPDFVFVCGDRSPSLAAAIAAAHLRIPVVHHSGGDVSGPVIDESIRHAITRFAHIHLPMTKESAERLKKMGEEPWRITVVGPLGIDAMTDEMLLPPEQVAKEFGLDIKKPVIMLIYHPLTLLSVEENVRRMRNLLEIISELKEQTVIIYPNSDSGGRKMIEIIKEYEQLPFVRVHSSVHFRKYLSLMRVATVMLGNSSGGLSETPYFKLPTINVGERQQGRDRATNVVDVAPEKQAIKQTLRRVLYEHAYHKSLTDCNNPFHTNSTPISTILKLLKKTKINNQLLVKRLTY